MQCEIGGVTLQFVNHLELARDIKKYRATKYIQPSDANQGSLGFLK